MTGACFLVNYMTSLSDPMRQYFGSPYVWILGENTRFRALDGVSSVSGSKVTPKKQVIGKGLFSMLLGDFPN